MYENCLGWTQDWLSYRAVVEIRARWWRFPVRFLFRPVEIFPKFTKTSSSLRKIIFDKLYCRHQNNLIQKQIFVMQCNHTLRQQTYSKRRTYYMLEMGKEAISKTFSRWRIYFIKEWTFYPASKNLFKVSKIKLEQRFLIFTPNCIFLTHSLEQQFHDFSVNTISTAISKKPS